MKIRVVIEASGKVSLFSDEGTFEAGAEKMKAIIETLKLEGFNFREVGEPEQHRHGPNGEHVHADGTVHSHGGN